MAANNDPSSVHKNFIENKTTEHNSRAPSKSINAVLENESQADSSTDIETLESSTCINHGFLAVPKPRRYDTFVPPKSMFDGVPKRGKSKVKKLLPWKRYQSAKSSVSSRSSHAVQSPYISKSSFNNLSPLLRNSGQISESAWQKPAPFIHLDSSINDESKQEMPITPPSVVEMNVPLSTSDSFTLPIVISPAFKFVPIGYSSDEDDCCSFHSSDYDVSRVDKSGDELTPFELDHRASNQSRDDSIDKYESSESDIKLCKARSSSSLDLISEEFSLVSLYEAEQTKSQSSDNEDCGQTQTQANSGDLWFLWEQVALLLSCGAQLTN
jgi:hypothetical protein